jgi:hypothetical protein
MSDVLKILQEKQQGHCKAIGHNNYTRKIKTVRALQLFRKERGLACRAEANGVGRSSAATVGMIVEPGEWYKYFVQVPN